MQAPRRHFHEARHRAVDPVTKTFALRVQIVESLPREGGGFVDDRRRFTHYPVTFRKTPHAGPARFNGAAELVAENHRVVHRPTLMAGILMQVAAAHPHRFNR